MWTTTQALPGLQSCPVFLLIWIYSHVPQLYAASLRIFNIISLLFMVYSVFFESHLIYRRSSKVLHCPKRSRKYLYRLSAPSKSWKHPWTIKEQFPVNPVSKNTYSQRSQRLAGISSRVPGKNNISQLTIRHVPSAFQGSLHEGISGLELLSGPMGSLPMGVTKSGRKTSTYF